MTTLADAGVQFSLPLIDFRSGIAKIEAGWGSVLITPDRLLPAGMTAHQLLGFSSHYP